MWRDLEDTVLNRYKRPQCVTHPEQEDPEAGHRPVGARDWRGDRVTACGDRTSFWGGGVF
jgi:hypothetical protein